MNVQSIMVSTLTLGPCRLWQLARVIMRVRFIKTPFLFAVIRLSVIIIFVNIVVIVVVKAPSLIIPPCDYGVVVKFGKTRRLFVRVVMPKKVIVFFVKLTRFLPVSFVNFIVVLTPKLVVKLIVVHTKNGRNTRLGRCKQSVSRSV